MNIAQLRMLIAKSIEEQSTTIDYLLLARAIESLNVGQIRLVNTYANLPQAESNEGLLVFVNADERIYWSNGSNWFSLSDKNRGLVFGWGNNTNSSLGDSTLVAKSSPVQVAGSFSEWCQVSSGCRHTIAIRSNGTAWSWGRSVCGVLGAGDILDQSSPIALVGGFTNWCQVSAGRYHSAGVRQNGSLWAWGSNASGVLGDNTTTNRNSPVSVVGGFTDWCQVSAGSSHTLGIRKNGSAWAWGCGVNGELGDGTTCVYSSPISVIGDFNDWCQISAGDSHSSGVRLNGTIWVWGLGTCGRLGNGDIINQSSPVPIAGSFCDWCQVSSGVAHGVAVRMNGTIWGWGRNNVGQVGIGLTTDTCSPVAVVGGFTDWCQGSAGSFHSIGIRRNGTAWAWGCNVCGVLGDNTTINRSSPVTVVGGFTNWCQVSAGDQHTHGIRGLGGF